MNTQHREHQQLIIDFYSAFQRLDWQAMASCYHPDARFCDPVFNELSAHEAGDMWHMLCNSAREFVLHFDHVQADETHGSARWEAKYHFASSQGGGSARKVHNIIFAEFQFADGKIIRHSDHFSFWRWSAQALGPAGLVLGWSAAFRRKVQQRAARSLGAFQRRQLQSVPNDA